MSDTLKTRLERTKERLDLYYEAEKAILSSQSYTIGSRTLTRANLSWVRLQINELENRCDELNGQIKNNGKGSRRAFRITLRDL